MDAIINTKQLRQALGEVVRRVRKGARLTVLYRSRPAFQIVPLDDTAAASLPPEQDSLYRAPAVGRSPHGRLARDHDRILYSK